MEIKQNEVYTPQEAQALLKISSSTVTRMIKKGLIRTAKVGKQYRIMGKELLRILSPELEDRVGKTYNRARRWVHEGVEKGFGFDNSSPRTMKIFATIQARMNSNRLPGKVLLEAKGKPLLSYAIERIRRCRTIDGFLVATSGESSDEAIVKYCKRSGIPCFRGSLDDVAARLLGAARSQGLGAFVRISADSPWIDFRIVDEAVNLFRIGSYDLVSNVVERTYPKGQSVEVIRVEALERAYPSFESPADREHVTLYFYRHPELFKIKSLKLKQENLSEVNLCVDDQESFRSFVGILERIDRPSEEYPWREIVKLSADFSEAGAVSR